MLPFSKSYSLLRDGPATAAIRLLGPHLWGKLYILFSSLRCFFGHIRTQLAVYPVSVSLGSALERHCQSYRPNRRTAARKQGIETLRATHPWADLPTLGIFLKGFDAGEQWGSDMRDFDSKPDLCSLEDALFCSPLNRATQEGFSSSPASVSASTSLQSDAVSPTLPVSSA
jgi:hypothetical protein